MTIIATYWACTGFLGGAVVTAFTASLMGRRERRLHQEQLHRLWTELRNERTRLDRSYTALIRDQYPPTTGEMERIDARP